MQELELPANELYEITVERQTLRPTRWRWLRAAVQVVLPDWLGGDVDPPEYDYRWRTLVVTRAAGRVDYVAKDWTYVKDEADQARAEFQSLLDQHSCTELGRIVAARYPL
jgi:hypothetical protein